jgi:hypothetical protein
MFSKEILKKFIEGPLVLLVGQNYLSVQSEHNSFLVQLFKKYAKGELVNAPTFDNMLRLGLDKNIEETTSWVDLLGKYINASQSIERMASVAWSAVFTSAIDPVLNNLFEKDWRQVQLICDSKTKVTTLEIR